ncbi:MAG: hypothetical protein N3A61_01700, partial [Ignavibacteria bacterium]|nr:hypothetical protein [Ignavibacteria bacterium]
KEKYELIDSIVKSYSFSQPNSLINNRKQSLDFTLYKVNNKIDLIWLKARHNIERMLKTINSSNPKLVLAKGYTIVSQNDKIIQRLKDFNKTQTTEIEFYDGKVKINE